MSLENCEFLEDLFKMKYLPLFRYALGRLNDPQLAEDAVQDTFCEALVHREELCRHPNPGAWLTNTLHFKTKKLIDRQIRDLLWHIPLDTCEPHFYTDNDFQNRVSILETTKAVLSPKEYRLLLLLAVEKFSHEEAARELGISVSASYKRMERIRKKLTSHL